MTIRILVFFFIGIILMITIDQILAINYWHFYSSKPKTIYGYGEFTQCRIHATYIDITQPRNNITWWC